MTDFLAELVSEAFAICPNCDRPFVQPASVAHHRDTRIKYHGRGCAHAYVSMNRALQKKLYQRDIRAGRRKVGRK